MTSRSLLAHVVSRFAPRQWENVATESVRYLLARPGAAPAMASLLAPLGFNPGTLTWRGQAVSAEDSSIPDLVGDDAQRRHVLIVEGKFWAELTANQPLGYLQRQALQFPDDPGSHLLLFLVPERREQLIAAELELRLGVPRVRVGPYQLMDRDGRRVAVITWAQVLAHLKTALEAAGDHDGLEDLAQLRGLCDRADAEAMLPISPEEIGSDRGHRVYEFCDVVDRVTDFLIADGTVDTKNLKATAAKGWYGRYLRSESGHIFLIGVLLWSWGHRYPTPFWVRFWTPSSAVVEAVATLEGDPRLPYLVTEDNLALIALRAPLAVEADVVVAELAAAVQAVCGVLPPGMTEEETIEAPT